jgi:hypothetical protein
MKKNLCDLCACPVAPADGTGVLSEAGGKKIIEITRSNPTPQVETFYGFVKFDE